MSRIGKLPVPIPAGVEVKVGGGRVEAKGPKGAHSMAFHPDMAVKIEDDVVVVKRPSESRLHRSLHGLTRSLIANLIHGVDKGFERVLEINGVGYRAVLQGDVLELSLGYAHPKLYKLPSEVEIGIDGNKVTVRGIDKKIVGQVAAKIRSYRPPEPYNGKGIKYAEEVIRRKAGKATA